MLKKLVHLILFSIIISTSAFSQETPSEKKAPGRKIPTVDMKTMEGKTLNSSQITNEGKPMIISFWATWCSPCKAELNAISDVYSEWQKETGVKLVAVSIDDARNMGKVAPYVSGKNWEFDVYLDPNGDFKRAMNVNNVPHTFIINGNGEIVWQQNSSAPGDEEKLIGLIRKVAAGEEIKE